ncbi:hypothetical protein JG687_00003708 [Phytophthora cactorum]|uniref:Uncharacterized protein n=1 Tax=Phytophthora cactorum TaxID=29920 RepID=A0A8T1UQS3_9STRA|nr:hypothetical protein PC123_g7487 [Phytophthora cactorum]KAG6968494.1 hypothetical protein JG687_00003708 [Phytophthora cactorum]
MTTDTIFGATAKATTTITARCTMETMANLPGKGGYFPAAIHPMTTTTAAT